MLSSMRFSLIYGMFTIICFGIMKPATTSGQPYTAGENVSKMGVSTLDTSLAFNLLEKGFQLGNIYPDSALTFLKYALKESRRIGYSYGIARALQLCGIIYSHNGRYEEGIASLKQLISYCVATGKHRHLLSLGYNIIGNIYQSEGKYNEAAYYYYRTLMLPKNQVTESTLALIYTNLSRMTHKLKQPAKALYHLSLAEELAIRNENIDLLCVINSNKGMIYADINERDSAKYYLSKAAQLLEQYKYKYDMQDLEYTNMVYLADLWLKEKLVDSAWPCIQKIQRIHVPIVPLYKNKAFWVMGKYYMQSGNYKKAQYYLQMSLDSAQTIHIGNDLANIHNSLSDLYTKSGKYREALYHKDQYILLKDSLENNQIANNVHQLEVRYRTAEKDKELINQKLQISQQQSDMREKNLWITIIASVTFLLTILSAILYKKRQSDKRLQQNEIQILQQQQIAMHQGQEIERLKAMMKGEERERSRLARELHDGIGGMLTAIKMNLSATRKKHPELSQFSSLKEIMHMLEDTGTEVRKTAHNLMPDVLVKHRLPEALMIYCENIHEQLPTELQFHGHLTDLDKAIELLLYRMIQELLQNILKHASATYAAVQLMMHEGKLSLTVEDNGTGFDPQQEHGGFGLQNLKYRVAALQGNISITSSKGRSTTIHIEFELEKLKLAEG